MYCVYLRYKIPNTITNGNLIELCKNYALLWRFDIKCVKILIFLDVISVIVIFFLKFCVIFLLEFHHLFHRCWPLS